MQAEKVGFHGAWTITLFDENNRPFKLKDFAPQEFFSFPEAISMMTNWANRVCQDRWTSSYSVDEVMKNRQSITVLITITRKDPTDGQAATRRSPHKPQRPPTGHRSSAR